MKRKEVYEAVLQAWQRGEELLVFTELTAEPGKKELAGPNHPEFSQWAGQKLPVICERDGQSWLVERVGGVPEIILVGGGHVARAVAQLAHFLEFHVSVLDDRPEFVTAERFPEAVRYSGDIAAVLQREFSPQGYYVIVTRGHKDDLRALEQILPKSYRYVGMIGSRGKVALTMARLREAGWDDRKLREVHAPIGLAIGAVTPAEIAVSIMAEILRVRQPFSGDRTQNEVFDALQRLLSGTVAGPAVMATIIDKKGSSPRGVGSKMLVTAHGDAYGTIGGGAVEHAAQVFAAAMARDGGTAVIRDYDLGPGDTTQLGMICGGHIQVLFEVVI